MKVLLVDDDEGTLVTMRIALTGEGFEVKAVSNGRDAIKALREESFDWLVTDGYMSPIHGFTIAAEAKRLQPNIKTVMISGVCDEKDIEQWPILKIFPKPVDEDGLISFLKSPRRSASA